jgi:hypothetical protein
VRGGREGQKRIDRERQAENEGMTEIDKRATLRDRDRLSAFTTTASLILETTVRE